MSKSTNSPARRPIPPIKEFLREKISLVEASESEGRLEQAHLFDPDSALAIRAALAARRPLLVKGEPGVGKTQLAEAAARVLKMPFVPFVVDSRTESRDLLWNFDAVMRLADAQVAAALGCALPSDGSQPRSLEERLHVSNYVRPGPLWWAFHWKGAADQADLSKTDKHEPHPGADPANGVVVLIDEIDKADSDVPNGLLEALGSGQFKPLGCEKHVRIEGPPPLVVITSNQERELPGAFERRCLVHHMSLPQGDELTKVLTARAEAHFGKADGAWKRIYEDAVTLLVSARQAAKDRLVSPLPGQAEYLDLLRAVRELSTGANADPIQTLNAIKPYFLDKKRETKT